MTQAAGDPYLDLICRDILDDKPGHLILDDDGARLKLFSFDSRLTEGSERTRIVQVEDGTTATLLDCFGGTRLYRGVQSLFTHQEIHANAAVLGRREWGEGELARRVQFTFAGAESAISYRAHITSRSDREANVDIDTTDYGLTNIAEVQCPGMRVKLSMSITRHYDWRGPRIESSPDVSIDLEVGIPVLDIYDLAHEVLIFFELSLGQNTRMHDIRFSPLTAEEQDLALEEQRDVEQFTLRLALGQTPKREWPHPANLPFRFQSPAGRQIASEGLRCWIARRPDWSTCYRMASRYLRGPDMFDLDRLLRAMGWFESIPLYQAPSAISHGHVGKLAAAAALEAGQRSIPVSSERLKQVLGELRRRPLTERLSEAVRSVRERFGAEAVPESCEAACHEAARDRNLVAHGDLPQGQHNFVRNIQAIELVSFLSMLSGLGLQVPAPRGHPLMAYILRERGTHT